MIKLFYHVHITGDPHADMYFVDEQIKRLQYSGLIEKAACYAVVCGPNPYLLYDLINRSRRFRILEMMDNDMDQMYEGRTLRHIQDEININDQVIYIHTKGISYLAGNRTVNGEYNARHAKAINGWRDEMEYYIIDQWQERLKDSAHYQTQGCYLLDQPFKHYMGNFWWAQGSYVLSLPHPMKFTVKSYPGQEFEETKPSRMRYEQWILLNEGLHKNIKLFDPKVAKPNPGYSSTFTPYEDDISLI
ncbi:MAG: hypothetical protein EBT86_09645 [Actinobacteria bacterium]|nr:hypothetical protein [Actinomycetota bacterium]